MNEWMRSLPMEDLGENEEWIRGCNDSLISKSFSAEYNV